MQFISEGEFHAKEFMRRLREESVNKHDPLPEWTIPRLYSIDFTANCGSTCICKKEIKVVYEIFNKNTNNRLEIGSDCAERWFKAKFICKQCSAPLGNIKKRLKEDNFICPSCSREPLKRRKEILKEYGNKPFWSCPPLFVPPQFRKEKLENLIENPEFCNFVLNIDDRKWKYYSFTIYLNKIKELVELTWDISEK